MSSLGRGLGSLIPNKKTSYEEDVNTQATQDQDKISGERIQYIDPSLIKTNPYQPRNHFDPEKMEELSESIKKHGIIQPLVVTKEYDGYQLIAGERRLRAAKLLNMSEVPVIVRSASDKDKLELSIIENVQRHNLNPLEEAESYRRLEEEFGLTREQIAEQVGRSAPTVANYLRILKLPIVIQEALRENQITFSHAKAIVGYPSKLEQIKIFKKILDSNLSVHQLEDLGKKNAEKIKEEAAKDPILTSWEDRLSRNLGAKVKIMKHADKGSIKIDFFSHEELRNILEKLS